MMAILVDSIATIYLIASLSYLFESQRIAYPNLSLSPHLYFLFLGSLFCLFYLLKFRNKGLHQITNQVRHFGKMHPVLSGLSLGILLCGLLFSCRYSEYTEYVFTGNSEILTPFRKDRFTNQIEWVNPSKFQSKWEAFDDREWFQDQMGTFHKLPVFQDSFKLRIELSK